MYIKKSNQDKIKTIFYTKNQIIKEYWFKITSKIKDIFNYFENHIKDEGYCLKSNYKIFGKNINEDCTISDLMKKEKNDIVLEGEIWLEVEEEIFYDDDNDETFYTILQPKLNPFELIEYNALKSQIKVIKCPEDIYLYYKLNKFTKESAFCNSINTLYMSGGEISGRAINNFWIINKHNYKINKTTMPIFKKYHSMVYIPDNFIFITGGDSLNSTIYDIENQEFINWAYMNKKHFQPGLLINGDFLYAFSALNDININNNYFEKTNLTSKNPKWEIIYLKYDSSIKMNSYFFGISKFSNGNILFVGGEKNNPNYIYNPIDNVISLSDGKNSSIPFWDKTFYKISKKYNACIPLNFNIHNKMIFLDKEKESLIEVKCDKNTGFVNFDINGNKDNDNPGNIFIKSTIKNIKTNQNNNIQIGSNPKDIFKKNEFIYSNYKYNNELNPINNNYDYKNDEDNLFNNERVIVNVLYDNGKNDEKYNYKDNKNYHKKSYLYIPDTFVDEQIINRRVDLVGNHNENNDKINVKDKNIGYQRHYINDIDDKEELIKEELIVVNDLKYLNDNNYIPSYKNRASNKKEILFIPSNAIEEQIINRELTPKENHTNFINYNDNNTNYLNHNKNKIKEELPSKEKEKNNKIEETIVIIYENNDKQDNDFKKKYDKNKQILYIPSSSIDDNIIYRKIEFNDDKTKDENNLKISDNSKPYMKKKIESNKYGNNSDILEDDLKENEIINYYGGNKDEIKNKKYQNKIKIYIPEYAIEDRILNREIISENKSF